MLSLKTILVPTDFSQSSDYAFRLAHALARDYGAKLVVLHAYIPPSPVALAEMDPMIGPPDDYRKMLEQKLLQVTVPQKDVVLEHRLVEGFPTEVVIETAREVAADLIVMGTHGRTGLGRLLLGSVAEHVLRQAPCPVVTAKAPPVPEPVKPQVETPKLEHLPSRVMVGV